MMDQLTGEVRDSVGCMPVDQLDAQNLPSFSENLATPSFSDTMGYPISMPSSSLPQLSLSLPDPLSQRQSDLNPTILCRPSLGPPIEPLPDVPVTQANTSGTGLLPSCTHAGSDGKPPFCCCRCMSELLISSVATYFNNLASRQLLTKLLKMIQLLHLIAHWCLQS